jgi:hypothetical protein
MTTIAWDGKCVAAESRKTLESFLFPADYNKIEQRGEEVFAHCGVSALFMPMIEWYLAGAIPKDYPTGGDIWFLVFRKGRAFCFTPNTPYPDEAHAPFGWGSGGVYAIGAMRAGADARRAVEIAIECDIESGGRINVMDLTFQTASGQ